MRYDGGRRADRGGHRNSGGDRETRSAHPKQPGLETAEILP
jgi:hypothetical protein